MVHCSDIAIGAHDEAREAHVGRGVSDDHGCKRVCFVQESRSRSVAVAVAVDVFLQCLDVEEEEINNFFFFFFFNAQSHAKTFVVAAANC